MSCIKLRKLLPASPDKCVSKQPVKESITREVYEAYKHLYIEPTVYEFTTLTVREADWIYLTISCQLFKPKRNWIEDLVVSRFKRQRNILAKNFNGPKSSASLQPVGFLNQASNFSDSQPVGFSNQTSNISDSLLASFLSQANALTDSPSKSFPNPSTPPTIDFEVNKMNTKVWQCFGEGDQEMDNAAQNTAGTKIPSSQKQNMARLIVQAVLPDEDMSTFTVELGQQHINMFRPDGERIEVIDPQSSFFKAHPTVRAAVFKLLQPSDIRKMRLICHDFRETIDGDDNIFIAARTRIFGPKLPDPPWGVSELQYSFLLDGTTCQRCGTDSSPKTVWSFARKWCQACFNYETRSKLEIKRSAVFKDEYDDKLVDKIFTAMPHAVRHWDRRRSSLAQLTAEKRIPNSRQSSEKVYWLKNIANLIEMFDEITLSPKQEELIPESDSKDSEIVRYRAAVKSIDIFQQFVLTHESRRKRFVMRKAEFIENVVLFQRKAAWEIETGGAITPIEAYIRVLSKAAADEQVKLPDDMNADGNFVFSRHSGPPPTSPAPADFRPPSPRPSGFLYPSPPR